MLKSISFGIVYIYEIYGFLGIGRKIMCMIDWWLKNKNNRVNFIIIKFLEMLI